MHSTPLTEVFCTSTARPRVLKKSGLYTPPGGRKGSVPAAGSTSQSCTKMRSYIYI